MTVYPIQANFVRGELSPKLAGRVDVELYGEAAADATNWLVMPQGGLTRRPGTVFVGAIRDESEKGRLVEFEFDEEQAYALLFNDGKVWFYTLGAQVTLTAQAITGITKANPAVVTYSGSDTYANGDRVRISGVVGMTEVNNRIFTVANVNTGANTFELSGVNSSGYTTYSSGGTVAEVVDVTTTYAEADIFDLQFAQAGDTVYIAHQSYEPASLVRSSETSWALADFSYENGPWLDEDEQGTYLTPAGTGGCVIDMSANTTSFTRLLLHCEGADGSTTFTDSSLVPKTLTANGNAQIDTAQFKFGSASGLFDGTGDYLSMATDDDTLLGVSGEPFTIDLWVRPATVSGFRYLINRGGGNQSWSLTNGYMWAIAISGAALLFSVNNNGASVDISGGTLVVNTWAHVALTYDGATLRGFVDGALIGSASINDVSAPATNNVFRIGIGNDTATGAYNGWMDEIRISKGIARWTAAFTPEAAAYSADTYTAADSDTSTSAWKAFDRDTSSAVEIKTTTGWVSIDFPSTNTKVCDAYWLAADEKYPSRMPTNWTFEGYNGSSWIVIDVRTGETTWAAGERRYYDFPNETAYQSYRLKWTAVDGDRQYSRVAELVLHERGASQTAFSLTASAVTGINGGAGFAATDPGRVIRLLGSDGVWRWATIVERASTTAVTIRLYGHALLDVTRISRWQLSPWSATDGYPRAVGFFQDRLGFAGTTTAPRTIWFSLSANYTDFGVTDPPVESDAITLTMTGGELSVITWIEEMSDLVVGTEAYASGIQPIIVSSAVRLLGPATAAEPFSSFNVTQKKQPLAMLYVDRYKKRLFEFAYNSDAQGFLPREISRLSEHLFAPGIVECFFQADRHNLAGFLRADGVLAAVTYEPENGIAGMTPIEIAGTGAVIESAAAIPSAGGAVVYLVVKRTINGQTRRYVEYLAPRYETGDTLASAVYFDCAFSTSVTAATTVTGVTWLAGETIGLLVNGVDVGDAVVSAAGTVTLPSTTTGTVVGGLRYTSRLETLRAPSAGNRDGTALGRQMKVVDVKIDMLEAKGLQAGSLVSTRAVPHAEREAAAGSLNTGVFPVQVDDRSSNDGVVVVTTDKGYPATIRSVIAGLEGAP